MGSYRIVIAAHGALAAALAESAELIIGSVGSISAVSLAEDQGLEHYAAALRGVLDSDDQPVLILTDLAGGTPANAARLAGRGRPHTWIIANAGLATLVEAAATVPQLTDDAVAELAAMSAPKVVAP